MKPWPMLAAVLLLGGSAAAHDGTSVEMAVLDAQIQGRPGDVDLLLQRAALARRTGDLSKSITDLEQVARRDPERRELFLERGLTLAAQGSAARAEADLDRFLDAGAPAAIALAARASIRQAAGRLAEARADYDEAIRLRPDPELYLARGRVDEARGQLAAAAQGYEEGMRALGGAVVLRLALVRVERARGRFDRAVALLDEVITTAPMKAEWLLHRADVHAAAGRAVAAARDRADALREIDAMLARRPTDLRRLTRARALLALGRKAEAIRELEGVVARSPRLKEAQALLEEARGGDGKQPARGGDGKQEAARGSSSKPGARERGAPQRGGSQ